MAESDLCTLLEWDTHFFGQRIARVKSATLTIEQANHVDLWCHDHRIDCLYFLADSNHAETVLIAEDYNYRQVDVRLTYELNVAKNHQANALPNDFDYTIDSACSDDLPHLLVIASDTFSNSRFYYDKYFTYEQANELYRLWLMRSIEDNFADKVIIFRKDNTPQGFITCILDKVSSTGVISLVSVAEQARGKQLGTHLVQQALSYFQQESMQIVQVVTQARNVGANRLYQNCGFRTKNVQLWYHKWFV
ncbi:MAG: GNAT family N-acetyltransferase [Phototrophicaceae bacterium]